MKILNLKSDVNVIKLEIVVGNSKLLKLFLLLLILNSSSYSQKLVTAKSKPLTEYKYNLIAKSKLFKINNTIKLAKSNNIAIENTGKNISLFFAVKDYKDNQFRDLQNPIKDAEKLAKSTNTIFGFDTIIYRNPTKKQIQKALSELRNRKFDKNDQLLIHFSGHGIATNKGFFIPADGDYNDEYGNSYYSYSDLELDITTIPSNHILLIFDACHSSTFNRDILLGKQLAENKGIEPKRKGELPEIQKYINKCMQFKSRLVITTGVDVTFDNSAFTNLFLNKFSSYISLNAEPVLSYEDLKAYIEKNFANSDFRTFEGHEQGGSFLFIVK